MTSRNEAKTGLNNVSEEEIQGIKSEFPGGSTVRVDLAGVWEGAATLQTYDIHRLGWPCASFKGENSEKTFSIPLWVFRRVVSHLN